MNDDAEARRLSAEQIGTKTSDISVEISTRFLEHFSEQLYSSPQKAFEELIANGWDAGASFVDVRIPRDLTDERATITVFDNGISMDDVGLRELWHIAFSPKNAQRQQYGRQMIGKFGIGKLATYVLANRLTYICKAKDSIIRRVTMDYRRIELQAEPQRLISNLSLELFEVGETELIEALEAVTDGSTILEIINGNVEIPTNSRDIDDEFGAPGSTLERDADNSWTLVILSGLKPTGRALKTGVLRRMLKAALPLRTEMVIRVNGQLLDSAKEDVDLQDEWKIDKRLGIDDVEFSATGSVKDDLDDPESVDYGAESDITGEEIEKETIGYSDRPVPHACLPEVGTVTGLVRLYKDRISGGKSEERGVSNGFFVNVMGRIINSNDPSFGEKNLNHAAWSRFRMTVRADGLDRYLTTNREQFQNHRALRIFRAFLRAAFNKARSAYDSDSNVEMPDGGDVLVKSLGVLSLAPLRSAVAETLKTHAPIPGLFDETGITDREEKRKDWYDNTGDNIRNALNSVKYEQMPSHDFVKFRISDNTIVINKAHPFVAEHTRTKAEKELMRTIAIVYLLSDIYGLETGIEPEKLQNVRNFRNRLMQIRALARRQSGTHIAQILLSVQNNSEESKQLETIVGDALEYLGFHVERLGKPGEPEGIARAFTISSVWIPTAEAPEQPTYSFTYDAKSTKHKRAKTGNLSLDGVEEHRNRYETEYALVVAPDFEKGAADHRARNKGITLMTAKDLGRLLELTVEHGAIPTDKIKEVFELTDHEAIEPWLSDLHSTLANSRKFTVDKFLKALDLVKGKVPDLLHPQIIQLTCRTELELPTVTEQEIVALVKGLAIAVPDLVAFDESSGKIVVNASAERVGEAVKVQLEHLHLPLNSNGGDGQ